MKITITFTKADVERMARAYVGANLLPTDHEISDANFSYYSDKFDINIREIEGRQSPPEQYPVPEPQYVPAKDEEAAPL